jgi:hypothetical protein
VVAAPTPGAAGTLRYEGTAPVRVGQFVAAGVGPQTPAGLLGRVVSARTGAGETVLEIEPASIVDAVPEGTINLGAVRSSGHIVASAGRRDFRSLFSCTGGGRAELDGSLAVRLIPTFRLDWSLDGVDSAEASATLRGNAALGLRLDAAGSCTLAQTSVASWDAPPLEVALGPIPVVLVPRTVLYVGGEARASGAVAVGIRGSLSASAGLRYDGDVHPIGYFRPVLSFTPPTARVTGALGARVVPSVTFLLYGQAGPRFDLSAGLRLEASATSSPWWKLGVPVELSAGLAVPNIDELRIPQQRVLGKTFPLAQADPDPTPAPDPPAGGGGDPGEERARISWDTAATDVDLHVWDAAGHHAWFRDPTGVPDGGLSEDDRHGFGPELFFDRAGGRALTFGLCYFDDTGAGPTAVSVRLTDPGGAVRASTHTLAHEGDHLLVGSTPAGSGYVPPEGWCKP